MTLEKQIAEDYGMVLKEAQSMGCNKIKALYNIPLDNMKAIVNALEEVHQYRAIGTVSELQDLVIGINALADSQFSAADMAKLVNDMKSLYEYLQIGTVEECRAAVEKQKEMIAYCDENDCSDCPYHGGSQEENRCMNDFIADDIAEQLKAGGENDY